MYNHKLGNWIGERVYAIINMPNCATIISLIISASIGIPIGLGLIDLFFRATVAS